MPLSPSSLRLVGATVLRDGQMQDRSVAIEDGRISRGPLPEVDLTGYYVLPGIVDLHGDAFERHLFPRPPAAVPIRTALLATDRDAAANGVTTAWLTQGWSWEGGIRGPDHAETLLRALDAYRGEALTDLRVQLRCETHTTDTLDRLLATVRRHQVDYVVFNNQLDRAVETSRVDPARVAAWARQAGCQPERYHDGLRRAQEQARDVPRYLCRLAEAFDTLGISYGSHDDCDGETREYYTQIGAKICAFPTRRAAAALARAVGDPILMGAPNIVLGGSQSGNVAAKDLVEERLCDALVSDYHYPSLAQAAFRLVSDGVLDLPRAWAMISAVPAAILRLPDRGVIDYGRRADLVVIHAATNAVEATICGGRITHLAGEAARRFLGARSDERLAAE